MIELLISSSAAGGLNTEKAFKIGRNLGVQGIELLPYKWSPKGSSGTPEKMLDLARKYNLPIRGIHLPFWWDTKSLPQVIRSLYGLNEKALHLVYQFLIGPGNKNCNAFRLMEQCPEAYILLHPDTFRQMPTEDKKRLARKEVFFENERIKKGENNTFEEILKRTIPYAVTFGIDANLMFDPRHYQTNSRRGSIKQRDLSEIWRNYRPAGLHFSFLGQGYNCVLPDPKTWDLLKEAIKENPPKELVLEIGPNKERDMEKAREIIQKDLGI